MNGIEKIRFIKMRFELERAELDALDLVAELVAWQDMMGGFESPCWRRAKAFIGQSDEPRSHDEIIGAARTHSSYATFADTLAGLADCSDDEIDQWEADHADSR